MVYAHKLDGVEHLLHVVLERCAVLGELLVDRVALVEELLILVLRDQGGITPFSPQRGDGIVCVPCGRIAKGCQARRYPGE